MITAPTKTIETPFSKHKVALKEWITGEAREYINAPLMKAVDAKPKMKGANIDFEMEKFDMNAFVTESDHREIETYVVSIDDETKDILKTVLSMHEDDTDFIKKAIKDLSKKKEASPVE